MKRSRQFFGFHGMCVGFLIVFLMANVSFAEQCEQWVAKAVSVQGDVEAKRAGEPLWMPVALNSTFCAGDTIRVLENSRAELSLVNQPILRLDQNSTITLGGVKEERTFLVGLIQGAAHFFSRTPRSIAVNTAFVNAGVEGTEFFVRVGAMKPLSPCSRAVFWPPMMLDISESAAGNQPQPKQDRRRSCVSLQNPGMQYTGPCIIHRFWVCRRKK